MSFRMLMIDLLFKRCGLRLAATAMLLLAAVLCSVPLRAQVESADILGRVADASNAVIPNAAVTVKNLDTGVVYTKKSNGAGEFVVTALPVGRYSVQIESQGFETYSVAELNLSQGDRARVDAKMVIGATVTVEVGTAEPELQTDSSVVGTVVNERQVEDLPLDGRNFMELAQILAGTNEGPPNALSSGNRPDDRRLTSSVSANGQDENANNQLIDGLDNNERIIGAIGVRPSVDAIAEFRVQTNLYTAEVGRSAGAIINVITKAGTNATHGSVYEFFRNNIFDASNYLFSGFSQPKTELRQNQYGASIGGPIRKDKLFYFADYEGYRQVFQSTYFSTVPTLFEEQNPGNFSDIGHTSVPAGSIDPIGLKYFQLYPAPNVVVASPTAGRNFAYSPKNIHNSQTGDGRVDYALNNGDRAFLRYTINLGYNNVPGSLPIVNGIAPGGNVYAYAGTSHQNDENAQIDYVHPFTQNLLGEFRVGYTFIDNLSLPLNFGQNLASQFGLPGANLGTLATSALTPASPAGYSSVGDGIFTPLENRDNTYQANVQFTLQKGKQTIKVGSSLIRREATSAQSSYPAGYLQFNTYTGGSAVFNPPGSASISCAPLGCLLRGLIYEESRSNQLVSPTFETWEPSGYVQDDWRVRQNLTLNLGVRYDVFTPFTEAHNYISNFNFQTATLMVPGVNGVGATAGVATDYSNLAPRLGFAYQAAQKTVFRGGFGLTYIPISSGAKTSLGNAPYVYNYQSVLNTRTLSMGIPIPVVQPPFNLNATNVGNFTVAGIDPHYRSTYIEQFNFTMQQEFGRNSFQMTYVGEIGKHLRQSVDLNLAPPAAYTLPGTNTACTSPSQDCYIPHQPYYGTYPNLTAATDMISEGYSSYNSLQTTFERRFTRNLGINANYTWAHGLNNAPNYAAGASGNGNLPLQTSTVEYGDSDLDIRNRFAILLNYALAFGSSAHGLKARLIKGWQTNAIWIQSTGLPFSITDDTIYSNTGTTSGERSLLVGNPTAPGPVAKNSTCIPPTGRIGTPDFYFNPCAFTYQAFGTYVPSRRNLLHGPHYRTFNLSVFKTFPIRENVKLQFRTEVFNLTNTPSFANPDGGLGDGTFGEFTSTRLGTTPRELQFALKLLF
jgi:hypothetical protein